MAANVAYIGVVPGKVIAIVVGTAAVETLEGDLSNLAVDDFKALAVQAHPTATDRALHPGICRTLVDLFHGASPCSVAYNIRY